jgi:hypothetical protein
MKRTPIDQIEFMRNFLAFLLTGAFIGAMAVFTFFAIPDVNKDILTYMVGQLSGMAITALGFYFVSKVGQDAIDAKKTENTGAAFRAVEKALDKSGGEHADAVEAAVDRTADAAVEEAADIKKGKKS